MFTVEWVFVVTHYSCMAMVGVAKCLKVFRRGTLVKNPSGAGRRSLRWETICWKCKEALGWTWKALDTWRQQCVLARKYEAPSKRIRTSLHAYLSWSGLENPHISMYTEGCKPQVQPKIPLSKPSSQKLTDTPLRSQTGMVAWPQSLHLRFHHFRGFLPNKTLHYTDIKRQTGYWYGYSIIWGNVVAQCILTSEEIKSNTVWMPNFTICQSLLDCFSQGSTFILEQGTSEWWTFSPPDQKYLFPVGTY